ncbi:LysO family transporter [Geofilum rubicundum]|uniref:DUF340 domain-containing protein n=1 Tax=Geofilum rubicundum JCM 15548 TaxID=1236989 RepID=A0A0E9LY91_9BACT|nr:LysO family transporter [Geofilum rubicundum]GAO30268.1 hypothetical protein JCM15548_12528 [Geofilum rubicundum JCM 15548]
MDILFVIGFFLVGIFLGRLFHTRHRVKLASEKGMMWAVYLLLFLLGVSVGNNPQIVENFHTLGWQAFLLSLGSLGGSLVLGKLLMVLYGTRMDLKKRTHEK